MSSLLEISLDDFNISSTVKEMFKNNNFLGDEEILLNLEAYKFVSQEDIIRVLKNKGISVSSRVNINRTDEPSLVELENKYNILIEVVDNLTCNIYKSVTNNVSWGNISLALPFNKVNYIDLTPYNFFVLNNKEKFPWNYTLLFNRLIMECIDRRGTDIHFVVEHVNKDPRYLVKFRVDDELETCDLFDFTREMNKDLITRVIHSKTGAVHDDLNRIEGVTTSISDLFGDGEISVRISANRVFNGYHCVCRLQKMSTVSLTTDQLGFSKRLEEDLNRVSNKLNGLTLITGAVRTGKNTTAFALANNMINTPIKIIDYSSPIEVLMPFTQVDYMSNVEYLVNCVRLAKKQDVNVVFLNEIPDKSVAFSIQDLVNSGIHVITTTHLNRLWHLPYKLYEFYGDDYKNILTQLNICVNQKMYSVPCRNCQNQADVFHLNERYRKILDKYGVRIHYVNNGCDLCDNGKVKGNIQPYAEYVYFDMGIVSDLLKLDRIFEMEIYLREYMETNNVTLEYELCNAIKEGRLPVTSLDSIL